MRNILGFTAAVLITACTNNIYPVSSPYFSIPTGTQIVVTQSLKIEPGTARVYFQHGKVVIPQERDQYDYHCWFLSWKLSETVQFIKPDTFIVSKVQHTDFLVQRQPVRRLAMSDFLNNFVLAVGGATATEYTTVLSIHSDQHPDIRQLVCSYWGDPRSGEHITVSQMQAALGDIVQIRLKSIQKGDY